MNSGQAPTLRRSQRRRTTNAKKNGLNNNSKNYNDDISDDDDQAEPFESSGSDFEEELAKKNTQKKLNGKKPESSESSDESSGDPEDENVSNDEQPEPEDDEEVLTPNRKPRRSLSTKSFAKKKIVQRGQLKRKLQDVPSNQTNGQDASSSQSLSLAFLQNNRRLSLSESSSDDDEECEIKKSNPVKPALPIRRPIIKESKKDVSDHEMDAHASSQLDVLASNLTQNHAPWMEKTPERDIEPTVVHESPSKFEREVAAALALGEKKESLSDDDTDHENEYNDENIKQEVQHSTAHGDIEVTLEMPGKKHKKETKSFDVQAYVKREISKARREIQLVMHQSHILCLIAHLRHINKQVNSPLLQAVALSIVPRAHIIRSSQLNSIKLTQMLGWFRSAIRVNVVHSVEQFPSPLVSHLTNRFQKFVAGSNEDLVLMFLAICRSLGWTARLVLNFNTLSLKPPKEEVKIESKEEKSKYFSTSKGKACKPTDCKNPKTANSSQKIKKPEDTKAKKSESIKPSRSTKGDAKSKAGNRSRRTNGSPSEDDESTNETETKRSRKESTRTLKTNAKNRSRKRNVSSSEDEDDLNKTEQITRKSKGKTGKKSSSTQSSKKSNSKSIKPGKRQSRRSPSDDSNSDGEQIKSKNKGQSLKTKSQISLPARRTNSRRASKSNAREKIKRGRSPSEEYSSDEYQPEEKTKIDKSLTALKSKAKAKHGIKSSPKVVLSQVAMKEAESRRRSRDICRKRLIQNGSDSSGEDFETMVPKKARVSEPPKAKSKKKDVNQLNRNNYWVEILIKKEWITVDVVEGKTNCAKSLEDHASKPMLYVIGCNADGSLKDVTKRYCKNYATGARKQRVEEKWFEASMKPFETKLKLLDKEEDKQLNKMMESAPMPTTVAGFKNHPLYVLPRHLLKFEAIYPHDAPTLGYLKSEPIYARECVKTLHCRYILKHFTYSLT